MKNLIENGEYFKLSRAWYNDLFLYPLVFRSIFSIFCLLGFLSIFTLAVNINLLLPLNKQIRYAISVEGSSDYMASITNAEEKNVDTYISIAKIFLRSYISAIEGYKYEELANRLLYIRNTSTRAIFNKYSNNLSIDNPNSPVLRLQRYADRVINVIDINFSSDNLAVITYNAKSIQDNGVVIEDTMWEATISFSLDIVDPYFKANSAFNFTVPVYSNKFLSVN